MVSCRRNPVRTTCTNLQVKRAWGKMPGMHLPPYCAVISKGPRTRPLPKKEW
jgi:hypothetical protein